MEFTQLRHLKLNIRLVINIIQHARVTSLEKIQTNYKLQERKIIIWIFFLILYLFLQMNHFISHFSPPYEGNCYPYLFISYKTPIIQWKKSSFFAIRRQFYNSRPDRRLLYRGQPPDYLQLTLVSDKIFMQSISLRRDWPLVRIFWGFRASEFSLSSSTHFSFYFTFIECNFPLLRLSSHK